MVTEAHETSARGAKTGPQGAVLGKNRASPPSPNRSLVRVAVASRLMASHWKKTGENLRGHLSLAAVGGGPTVLIRPLLRFRSTTVGRGSWGTLLAGLFGLVTTVQKLG